MTFTTWFAHIDWPATGAMLQGLGTVGGAVAVYAAARFGFAMWRRQKLAERNRDQAEIILHAAYNARRALNNVRAAFMPNQELVAAEQMLATQNDDWRKFHVKEKQARMITTQAYYTRLSHHRDEHAKLFECIPLAKALFGDRLEQAMENLIRQFIKIRVYADSYVNDYNGRDHIFSNRITKALFYMGEDATGEPDEITDNIKQSIKIIEEICLPHLRMQAI